MHNDHGVRVSSHSELPPGHSRSAVPLEALVSMPVMVWRNAVRWLSWLAAAGFVVFLTMWLLPQARMVGAQVLRLGLLGSALGVASTWLITYATAARWDVAKAHSELAAALRKSYGWQLALVNRPRPLPTRWAARDRPAARRFEEISGYFRDEVPGGRLVILGEAGSGKSVLAAQLAADLLADDPVKQLPVVLDVARWNPATDLWQWIGEQLADRYPALRKKIALGIDGDRPALAQVLAAPEHLLPVLDGFDALPRKARTKALARLNGLGTRDRLVVICRTKAFDDTVSGGRGLHNSSIIEVQPLDPAEVGAYLMDNSDPDAARWEAVLAGPDAGLTAVLTNPAIAWLVHRTYEHGDTTPAELLSVRGSLRDHLIDRFLERVAAESRWAPGAVAHRLGTLARLAGQDDGEIRWWRLVTLTPPGYTARAGRWTLTSIWMIAALAVGAVMAGPFGAFVMAVPLIGTAAATHRSLRIAKWRERAPSRLRLPRGPGPLLRVAAAVVPAAATALALRAGAATWLQAGCVGLIVLILLGQALTAPGEVRLGTSPDRVLATDRMLAIVRGLLFGPAVAVVVAMVTTRFVPAPIAAVFAVAGGAVGLFGGASTTAWCQFVMARLWLASHGLFPWRAVAFLRDAERWGILRAVGGGYEFRDPSVRRRVAAVTGPVAVRLTRPVVGHISSPRPAGRGDPA